MGRYLIRLLAIMVLYVAAHCAVLWYVRAPIAAEYWVRETLIVKRDRIASVPSPRLILLGGSSTLFAFDPQRMQDALGIPVYDYGIHASMRLEWILAEGERAAKPGDTILLVLEPPFFECASQSWDSWQLRNALAWNRAYLDTLPPLERVRALLTGGTASLPYETLRAAAGSPAPLLIARRAAMVPPAEILARDKAAPASDHFQYSAVNFGPLGEMRNTEGGDYKGAEVDPSLPSHVCPSVGAQLKAFAETLRARGVRVLMDYAPYLIDTVPPGIPEAEDRFSRDLASYGLRMLSSRKDELFARRFLFDTYLHLNTDGRAIRTERAIQRLRAAGVSKS